MSPFLQKAKNMPICLYNSMERDRDRDRDEANQLEREGQRGPVMRLKTNLFLHSFCWFDVLCKNANKFVHIHRYIIFIFSIAGGLFSFQVKS